MSELDKRQTFAERYREALADYQKLMDENGRLTAELADCRQVISDMTRFPVRNGDGDTAHEARLRMAAETERKRKLRAAEKVKA